MEESSKWNLVNVEPFIHQVGGHSSLLCFEEETICKPLVPRELEFYETLPEALCKFVPTYYGVVHVSAVHEEDDYIRLVARLPDNYQPQIQKNNGNSHSIRVRRSGSIEVEGIVSSFVEDQIEEGRDDEDSVVSPVNPWVQKCHRATLQVIMTQTAGPNFILLENLAHNFKRPCILDLKMGTRHYDDMATLPKKQSKMFKVVSTTSGKLGARVGGMQVYQTSDRRYLCRNKFYGRGLTVSGFAHALRQFLHNGRRLRTDVLPPLIRRLQRLVEAVAQTDAVRFYTTSLLLIYEGDDSADDDTADGDNDSVFVDGVSTNDDDVSTRVDNVSVSADSNTWTNVDNNPTFSHNVSMNADNASEKSENDTSADKDSSEVDNVITKVGSAATTPTTAAANLLQCLDVPDEALKRYASAEALTSILPDPTEEALRLTATTRRRRSSVGIDDQLNLNLVLDPSSARLSSRGEGFPPPRVDVRIIDFAHSTHKEIEHEAVAYSGPDRGFLFGLENLLAVLRAIEREPTR